MDSAVSAHQRKIELQAPEDLTYLLANVRRAAAEHINEAFPPTEGAQGEYELRTRIEDLVNEYITKTFTLAAPNLSINGLELSDDLSILSPDYDDAAAAARRAAEPEVVFAPFDARARARVEDLTREEEDLLRDIAALKKSVPGAAATAWAESARASVRADEEALAAAVERARSGANNNNTDGSPAAESAAAAAAAADAALQLDVARLERQDEVEASYGRAIDGLARLKREMPAVVARMERARAAGSYVVTEK